MIPDNFPGCKIAFQKWKDLGDGVDTKPGHRDKIWDLENKRIDFVNSLAKAEYIRLHGNDECFIPIPHLL